MLFQKQCRWRHSALAAGLCAIGLLAASAGQSQEPLPAPQIGGEQPSEPGPPPGEPTPSEPTPAQPADPTSPQQPAPENAASATGRTAPLIDEEATEPVVLESGPVHEAFASPVTLNAEAGPVVPKQPPEPVNELPPETRPQGDNVAWIPGYWSWSDEQEDYIWVSGVWRDVPPNQEWVPGYWTQADDGYRWTHGFWSPVEAEEFAYLPPPPESLEVGPPSPQPGDNYFYVPGCWQWSQAQYVWRPGFWSPAYADWMWVPSRYYWTPRGYIFLGGYWDYPLIRRGFLFAPVWFPRPFYLARGYRFSPNFWISTRGLTAGLFVSPFRRSYFFGNFYGPRYASAGYYPWFSYHNRRFGYDPIFAYTSSRYRGPERDRWLTDLRNEYDRRAEVGPGRFDGQGPDRGPRPGDGIVQGPDRDGDRGRGPGRFGDRDGDRGGPQLVRDLRQELPDREVQRLSSEERTQLASRFNDRFQNMKQERSRIETSVARTPGREEGPDRVSRSQFGSRPSRSEIGRSETGRSATDAARSDRGRDFRGPSGDRSPVVSPRDRQGGPERSAAPERSGVPRQLESGSDRGRALQPGAGQPRADQPRIGQPRTDSPRTGPPRGDQQPRAIQPRSEGPRPDAGRSGSIQRPSPSPGSGGPPAIRQDRGSSPPQFRGPSSPAPSTRSFTPQPRQSAPQTRNYSPQPRQSAPQFRSSPQPRQSAPQFRGSSPSSRPSPGPAPSARSFGGGGGPGPGAFSRGGGGPSRGGGGGGGDRGRGR